jgi:hypothetical protein
MRCLQGQPPPRRTSTDANRDCNTTPVTTDEPVERGLRQATRRPKSLKQPQHRRLNAPHLSQERKGKTKEATRQPTKVQRCHKARAHPSGNERDTLRPRNPQCAPRLSNHAAPLQRKLTAQIHNAAQRRPATQAPKPKNTAARKLQCTPRGACNAASPPPPKVQPRKYNAQASSKTQTAS